MIDKVMEYAKSKGYNDIRQLESWNGYEIFEPILHEDAIIGIPFVIMVKGNNIRMSTPKETFEYMDRK